MPGLWAGKRAGRGPGRESTPHAPGRGLARLERRLHKGIRMALPADTAAAPSLPTNSAPAAPPATEERVDPLFAEFLRQAPEPSASGSLREWVDLAEAWRITRALRDCRGNRAAAARALGIGRRTLYTKMEKLGL